MLFASLLSIVAISTTCISLAKTDRKPSTSPTTWHSNSTYANQLSEPVKVDQFYMKPPVGYALDHKQIQNSKNIADEYNWRGPAGPDGTKPRLVVAVFKLRPGFVNNQSAEKVINLGLEGLSSSTKHYVHTDIQNGKVAGLDFVRAYWKRDPNDTNEDRRFHGFQYVYSQDNLSVTIIGEDIEPHYKSTIDLLEASALTFHK